MNLQSIFAFLILYLVQQICAQCDDGSASVRLTGGPNKFEGRVEVCGEDGSWGQVCAMGWTRDDARVVCRELGHSTDNPQPVLSDDYDGEAAPARINNVRCNGSEAKLLDCRLAMLNGSNSCAAPMGPAGVVCQDPECLSDPTSVRLSEEQVVEVCTPGGSGFRTGVCSSNWDDTDASVVCRQLSLGDNGVASSTASVFYRSSGAYDRVNCNNSDQTLSDCEHVLIGGVDLLDQCSTGQFAQVECKAFAATTTPGAETTTPQAIDSTTTGFEDPGSTTTDVESPTSESTTTDPLMGPDSPQSQSGSQLLAIVLGAVGGLIVVLLFGIIVLLIVVILSRQRRKYSMQYIDDSANGQPVMASIQVTGKEDQLANSYSSQKGGGGSDPERHLLNPLYLQNQQQMANSNPLPYASVLAPPSTADDSQLHEYATLDNFQPTVNQWPPEKPQEYSNPIVAVSGAQNNRTSGVPNVYSEPVLPGENYKVGEDGIVTDLQGYASLDHTAHSYDYPLTSVTSEGAKAGATGGVSTLPIPQPYETPFESSYEDASSTNMSRSTTPAGSRRESPERRDTDPATNRHTSTTVEEKITPYAEPSPVPKDMKTANSDEALPTHDYATLEPPK